MGGLEVAQAAVLDERDLAASQLELQQVAVVRGAHQHRLAAKIHLALARRRTRSQTSPAWADSSRQKISSGRAAGLELRTQTLRNDAR